MSKRTAFSKKLANQICARLIEGESLRSICRDESMPCMSTVCKWLAARSTFAEQYARAREAQADTLADEILDIADDGRNDWIERENTRTGQTYIALNDEHVQRSRLRVDARKWAASKLKPKKYGDSVALTHRNPDGSNVMSPLAEALGNMCAFPNGGPGQSAPPAEADGTVLEPGS